MWIQYCDKPKSWTRIYCHINKVTPCCDLMWFLCVYVWSTVSSEAHDCSRHAKVTAKSLVASVCIVMLVSRSRILQLSHKQNCDEGTYSAWFVLFAYYEKCGTGHFIICLIHVCMRRDCTFIFIYYIVIVIQTTVWIACQITSQSE